METVNKVVVCVAVICIIIVGIIGIIVYTTDDAEEVKYDPTDLTVYGLGQVIYTNDVEVFYFHGFKDYDIVIGHRVIGEDGIANIYIPLMAGSNPQTFSLVDQLFVVRGWNMGESTLTLSIGEK